MSKFKVVIVDRPAWFVPDVEREALSSVDAEVLVGWARLGGSTKVDPEIASLGLSIAELSRISLAYVPRAENTVAAIEQMAHDADAIIATTASVTGEVMDRLPRLRVIGRPGVGFDIVDVDAATARGIAVFSAPGFCAREVADHTMMLALGLARKAAPLGHAMRRGMNARSVAAPIRAIYEMTLGLVAFGEIARAVAVRAKPFGFTLLAFDPYVNQKTADPFGVTLVPLDELLARSDIVSLHAPLTKETHHLLSTREFQIMKPTAYVINTARGSVIDETALITALRDHRIAGAGLDVYEREPLERDSPLLAMDNVILTPHMAGLSDADQVAVRSRTARNVANALVGEWPPTRDLVNPAVKHSRRPVPPPRSVSS